MFCSNCGKEFDGNFCSNCGAQTTSSSVNTRIYKDKFGYDIDLPTIYGAYKTRKEIKRFLGRWTNYLPAQIDEILDYMVSNVTPIECSIIKSLQVRAKIESSNKEMQQTDLPITEINKNLHEQTDIQSMQLAEMRKANKLQEQQLKSQAKCPRCGSTSLSGNKKGFGIGKAVIGATVMANPLGLIAGNLGAKKVRVTCLKCGKQWKA